jgi:CRP-like cAMP-binding protein
LRHGRAFCNFADPARQIVERIGYPMHLRPGEPLFHPGEPYRGAFVVCWGELKLRGSHDGRSYERTVGAGEVVGLEPILARRSYDTAVSAVTRCKLRFIPADPLRRLLREDFDACIWAMHFV